MSIKIFYIPINYLGFTENLLETAIEKSHINDYSKILYIAPTYKKIIDSQIKFHRLSGGSYIPPEMLTIKQLSKRFYSFYGDKKVLPLSLVPIIISKISKKGIGYASIITNFIHEIKQHHTGKDIDTLIQELADIFHELGIPEDISARTYEALRIFKEYQETVGKHSALDENDVLAACPGLIKEHNCIYTTLILDGFYELTKSEEEIIKALIENSEDTLISIPYDNNFTYITDSYINFIKNNFQTEESHLSSEKPSTEHSYYPYPGIEEEIEGIARSIKHNYISGKTRDMEKIIVTFPMLYKYANIVSRVFRRYGIPHTISPSKSAGRTQPFLDLVALLESVADDFPRLSFSQFLTSPYFNNLPLSLHQCIPNICLKSGIIKGKDAWLSINTSGLIKDSLTSEFGKDLRWIFKKLAPLESIKNNRSFSQYCEIIIKILNDFDFSDFNNKNLDLKDKALELLKELSFIDNFTFSNSFSPPQTLHEFIEALKHILNATDTESEGTGVQVVGFHDLMGIEPETLYFGGLRDGDLPSKPDIDHLLPDTVRTQFNLVNLNRYLLVQKFTFYRTIESAKNCNLSYPVMEGDRFFLASPFLPWDRESKQQVHGIFSKEEELLRKIRKPFASYITELEGIGKKLIDHKFGNESYIRVTDIDSYRTCPRKFFIERVLQLEPLEIKEYEVEAKLLGTIAHEIMQVLISKPFSGLDDLKVRAETTIDTLLSDKHLENYWKELIKDTFLLILPDIYKIESNLIDEGYSFLSAEVSVKGEITKGIKLKGKIDRVDKKTVSGHLSAIKGQEKNKFVELIDYKTGTIQFSGPQVLTKGATLQLFLYAALMRALGTEVERVGIYSLKDLKISWIPGRNDKKNGRTIDNYIEASLHFLVDTVLKIRRGYFPASPLNEQTCRNCPERSYCPYIQKTVINTKMSL
ncbi:MAG: hypothetical protein A2Y97_06160 [Nitrospirae bacterium RBG_13_39_12]|nr:MAG: hypothetical protein A2Y97_06160 [Nitrospirae bacterium RBG_13_39_12]